MSRGRLADGLPEVDVVDAPLQQCLCEMGHPVRVLQTFEGAMRGRGDIAAGAEVPRHLGHDPPDAVHRLVDGGVDIALAERVRSGEDSTLVTPASTAASRPFMLGTKPTTPGHRSPEGGTTCRHRPFEGLPRG